MTTWCLLPTCWPAEKNRKCLILKPFSHTAFNFFKNKEIILILRFVWVNRDFPFCPLCVAVSAAIHDTVNLIEALSFLFGVFML